MSAAQIHRMLWLYGLADLVLAFMALGVWFVLRHLVHRSLAPLPATLLQPAWKKFAVGVAWAGVALGLCVVPIWIGRGYVEGPGWSAFAHSVPATALAALSVWALFALQALYEELLFRAVGLGLLAALFFWLAALLFVPRHSDARPRHLRLTWLICGVTANLVVAGAFASAHLRNPELTPQAVVNICLAGLVLGQLFWMQGTPVGAWGMHWVWNAGLASLGLPVSGIALTPALLGVGFKGARAGSFSGGAFGPEGSLVCTLVFAVIWFAMLWQMARGARRIWCLGGSSRRQHRFAADGRQTE
jgi:membrane protease YdiL (CAAX protease family)